MPKVGLEKYEDVRSSSLVAVIARGSVTALSEGAGLPRSFASWTSNIFKASEVAAAARDATGTGAEALGGEASAPMKKRCLKQPKRNGHPPGGVKTFTPNELARHDRQAAANAVRGDDDPEIDDDDDDDAAAVAAAVAVESSAASGAPLSVAAAEGSEGGIPRATVASARLSTKRGLAVPLPQSPKSPPLVPPKAPKPTRSLRRSGVGSERNIPPPKPRGDLKGDGKEEEEGEKEEEGEEEEGEDIELFRARDNDDDDDEHRFPCSQKRL